ncbi:tRNA (adenosine(37)-N6)-dimethylallyltransferase MiaA [Heyndrickxia ginsengihumi]|uniref:tRNA dimethylallyltransferase n=1 Tax=Heyndrickxia ginsengihumi TaxID=363870 RepID=A0A6M0P6Z8_9BACI|nr:tRNA (adenosine(37)-N6)-dimethylallyltransferase MiaA [Heyndrickxia ginsengihumi]MCM3023503.1 tRNA (adenosine(37)-N6)-dimethylallyltransferase MiaA [Heyndrickxia ginsengihumi]NEY20341.1 tRNA (adenosine(37)-N6)-dimethylallyltransferase MiaA [Heyndrickxia ginsengihumi]
MEKEKLIVLIGPTAVGKTELSIALAKRFDAEIISGDSMQVYKGMDIGTAKISEEEMGHIPHHLIDIKEPDESFSVAEFQQLVRNKISDIHNRNKMPMIVGGTGLYIQSIIYDYQFSDISGDEEYRTHLEKKAKEEGAESLFQLLKQNDPESAKSIHPNNVRRVIRALEIYHFSGKTVAEYQKTQKREALYDIALIGLTMDRDKLYERINKRVDQMMEQGLLEEVKKLYERNIHDVQSIQAIGYKELYAYLDGRVTLEDAVEQLKQNTRRFAKRQLTWFRNKMDVQWFDMTNESEKTKKFQEISDFIAGKLKLKSNI